MNPRIVISLAKQLQQCQKKCPDGVKVLINEADITDIQAEITGPAGTPYEGGIYRCKLAVEGDFPESAPKGYFMTKIFHPNVSQKGEICVNTLKKDWDPKNWSIYNILEVVKCLLIVPFPESALNQQAGKMFMEDYDEYFKHAKLINGLHAAPKQLKVLQNNTNVQKIQEQKPEKGTLGGVKKQNDKKMDEENLRSLQIHQRLKQQKLLDQKQLFQNLIIYKIYKQILDTCKFIMMLK